MFQHDKKDYYSVNVEIALQANQEQRLFETQLQLQQQQYQNPQMMQQAFEQSQSHDDQQ
jgi:hypothetical protein